MPYSGSASVVRAKRQAHWLRVRDEEIAKRHAAIGPRPVCEICGGFVSRKSTIGVCQRNSECMAENRRRTVAGYRKRHAEKVKAYSAERWRYLRETHPDKIRTWKRAEYARRKAAGHRAMLVNVEYLWAAQDGLCFLCIEPMDRDGFHVDHYVPLARGGRHEYGNVYLTHSVCNMRKHAKVPDDGLSSALIEHWG